MRKNVFKLAMIAMALFLSTACFAQAGKVNNFRIKRGTNVSHWLSQSEQRGVSPSTRCSSGMRKATS